MGDDVSLPVATLNANEGKTVASKRFINTTFKSEGASPLGFLRSDKGEVVPLIAASDAVGSTAVCTPDGQGNFLWHELGGEVDKTDRKEAEGLVGTLSALQIREVSSTEASEVMNDIPSIVLK
ncbi:MAG TPA: hypothetical protein VM581_03580 [Magnetospirillaceae bacterium]|nr:hypothetical protein [Magnetospirillaceae bacterium]